MERLGAVWSKRPARDSREPVQSLERCADCRNLLTPEVVLQAAQSEIRTGRRVSLNWSMFEPHKPAYGRIPFEHKLWRKGQRHAHDDSFSFNSQCSSQWDGLRHYGYQQHGVSNWGILEQRLIESCTTTGRLGRRSRLVQRQLVYNVSPLRSST